MFGMGRSRAAVIAFALAGLVLVAGVTYLASRLVSQPIGLAEEPATLGRSLAPAATTTTSPRTTTRTVTTTVPTTTSTAPPTTTSTAPPTTTATTLAVPTTSSTTPDTDDHGRSSGGDRDDD